MVLYFEFTDNCMGVSAHTGRRRITNQYHSLPDEFAVGLLWPMQLAVRAWKENEDGVIFLKNRYTENKEVDLEEFFWIKLSSVPL